MAWDYWCCSQKLECKRGVGALECEQLMETGRSADSADSTRSGDLKHGVHLFEIKCFRTIDLLASWTLHRNSTNTLHLISKSLQYSLHHPYEWGGTSSVSKQNCGGGVCAVLSGPFFSIWISLPAVIEVTYFQRFMLQYFLLHLRCMCGVKLGSIM